MSSRSIHMFFRLPSIAMGSNTARNLSAKNRTNKSVSIGFFKIICFFIERAFAQRFSTVLATVSIKNDHNVLVTLCSFLRAHWLFVRYPTRVLFKTAKASSEKSTSCTSTLRRNAQIFNFLLPRTTLVHAKGISLYFVPPPPCCTSSKFF